MADGFEIKVIGADQLAMRLGEVGTSFIRRSLQLATLDGVEVIKEDGAVYPPETEANRPPPPYYIRGVGSQITETENLHESQQLGTRWQSDVEVNGKNIVGTVTNPVTYAPHVHGINTQKWFHKQRGWRNVKQIAEDVTPRVLRFFDVALDAIANFISGGQ